MASTWSIAAVQMDCRFADQAANPGPHSAPNCARLPAARTASSFFPECDILTGYCFESKAEAWPFAKSRSPHPYQHAGPAG